MNQEALNLTRALKGDKKNPGQLGRNDTGDRAGKIGLRKALSTKRRAHSVMKITNCSSRM